VPGMDPKDARIAELMEEIEDLRHRLRKYEGNPTTLPEEHPEVWTPPPSVTPTPPTRHWDAPLSLRTGP